MRAECKFTDIHCFHGAFRWSNALILLITRMKCFFLKNTSILIILLDDKNYNKLCQGNKRRKALTWTYLSPLSCRRYASHYVAHFQTVSTQWISLNITTFLFACIRKLNLIIWRQLPNVNNKCVHPIHCGYLLTKYNVLILHWRMSIREHIA